jgi:opacity protein-like surface antigen
LSGLFSIYGKAGGVYGWTRTRNAAGSGAIEGNDNGLNWSYGAGIQLDVNRSWAVKADWDHYRFDYVDRTDDAQLYSLNLVYKF